MTNIRTVVYFAGNNGSFGQIRQGLTLQSPVVTSSTITFNTHKSYVLPTQCIYMFCVDLRTNSDYFPIQHLLTAFYNRDGVCLLRGTDWIFKYESG
jgi:hypothetical protein